MGYHGDYTFVLARLGPLHLGCIRNREVAALLRWLLTQVSLIVSFQNSNSYLLSIYTKSTSSQWNSV